MTDTLDCVNASANWICNNTTTVSSRTTPTISRDRPMAETVIYTGILFAITLFTFVGNLMVLVAFAYNKKLRTVTIYPIVSLAVSDFLLSCLVMPFSAWKTIQHEFPFGIIWCNLQVSSAVMLTSASVLNLTLISLDRYFSITKPLLYDRYIVCHRAKISCNYCDILDVLCLFGFYTNISWLEHRRWTNSECQKSQELSLQSQKYLL